VTRTENRHKPCRRGELYCEFFRPEYRHEKQKQWHETCWAKWLLLLQLEAREGDPRSADFLKKLGEEVLNWSSH